MKVIHTLFACTVVAQMLCASAARADDSVLPGPYSSWTDGQKTQAAFLLKNQSNQHCYMYIQRAENGGMRATYESAACIEAYYVLHLPADYPGLDALKDAARKNYAMAKSLGSDIPSFLGEDPNP